MNRSIIKYLKECRVITFATSLNDQPYCAHCFFAFDPDIIQLVFLSEPDTRHISEALTNSSVAGTVNSNLGTIAQLKGIQFTGVFKTPSETDSKRMYALYYTKFPFAKTRPSPIWAIELHTMKMTDNTFGFGTKFYWNR